MLAEYLAAQPAGANASICGKEKELASSSDLAWMDHLVMKINKVSAEKGLLFIWFPVKRSPQSMRTVWGYLLAKNH
jgi:hypothetical protein